MGTARRPKHSSKNGPSLAGRGGEGGGGGGAVSIIARPEDRLELHLWGTSTPFQAMDDEYNDHFRPGEDLDGEDEDQVWRQILPTQEDEIALAAMFAEDQQNELVQSFVGHEEGEQAGGIQEPGVAPPQEEVDEEMDRPIVLRWDPYMLDEEQQNDQSSEPAVHTPVRRAGPEAGPTPVVLPSYDTPPRRVRITGKSKGRLAEALNDLRELGAEKQELQLAKLVRTFSKSQRPRELYDRHRRIKVRKDNPLLGARDLQALVRGEWVAMSLEDRITWISRCLLTNYNFARARNPEVEWQKQQSIAEMKEQ